jgi:superfamily II DNA helicase RecQ
MKYRFFCVPVEDTGAAQEELNRFLTDHRILSVDKEFAADGRHSLWCFCVSYIDGEEQEKARGKGKIDYREVLPEDQFAVYAKLRALRKQLAERDGVPAYALFTNEQLADMVRKRPSTLTDLEHIGGVGKARVEKYGSDFLAVLRDALSEPSEGAAGGRDEKGPH